MERNSDSAPWYADASGTDTTRAEGQTGAPILEQAKQQTQQVIQQTQQKAGEAMDRARTQVVSQLETQKERASGGLETVALALRQTGDHLRQQDQTKIGEYADGAANAVEQLSGFLSRSNVNDLLGEVEGFARRQPAVFLGSTFALGFLASRFLKSSTPSYSGTATYGSTGVNTTGLYGDRDYPSGAYRSGVGTPALPGTTGVRGVPRPPVDTLPE